MGKVFGVTRQVQVICMEPVQAHASVVMHRDNQTKAPMNKQQSVANDDVSEKNTPPPARAHNDRSLVKEEQPVGSLGDTQPQEKGSQHEQPTSSEKAAAAAVPSTTAQDAQGSQTSEKPQKKDSQSSRAGKLVFGGPCVQCGATRSTLFRKCSDGRPLCNACGLRYTRSLQKHQNEPSAAEQPPAGEPAASQQGDASLAATSKKIRRTQSDAIPKTRRKLPPDELRRCQFCATTTSPQWRYCDKQLACNACALRKQRREDRFTRDVQDGPNRKAERRSAETEQLEEEAGTASQPPPAAQAVPDDSADTDAPTQPAPPAAGPPAKVARTATPPDGAAQPGLATSQALLACISYFASSLPQTQPDEALPTSAVLPAAADTGHAMADELQEPARAQDATGQLRVPADRVVMIEAAPAAAGTPGGHESHGQAGLMDAEPARPEAAAGAMPGAEQPPDSETVRGIVALLQSGGLVAAAEAHAYMTLWEQLDEFRQRAARFILVDALLWKQQPDGAVKHIRAVLADNS